MFSIPVCDSSVLKGAGEELPNEQFLYCADCAHTPWGDKPESFIVERTRAIVHFLLEKRAKAILPAIPQLLQPQTFCAGSRYRSSASNRR